MVEVIDSEHQCQRNGSDSYLADGSDEERPCSLFEEIFQVGSKADSGEGEQEGPTA